MADAAEDITSVPAPDDVADAAEDIASVLPPDDVAAETPLEIMMAAATFGAAALESELLKNGVKKIGKPSFDPDNPEQHRFNL